MEFSFETAYIIFILILFSIFILSFLTYVSIEKKRFFLYWLIALFSMIVSILFILLRPYNEVLSIIFANIFNILFLLFSISAILLYINKKLYPFLFYFVPTQLVVLGLLGLFYWVWNIYSIRVLVSSLNISVVFFIILIKVKKNFKHKISKLRKVILGYLSLTAFGWLIRFFFHLPISQLGFFQVNFINIIVFFIIFMNQIAQSLLMTIMLVEIILHETENELTDILSLERNTGIVKLIAAFLHRLGSPVNVIITATELLQNSKSDGQCDQEFALINSNANRLKNTISQFRTLFDSDISWVKQVYVETFFEQFQSILKSNNDTDQIILEWESEIEILQCDKMALIQTMLILIQNVQEHAYETGDKLVDLKIVKEKKHANRISICIKDFGKGMSKAKQHKVFESYWSSDKKRLNKGMGLFLCNRFVTNNLHGSISLNSTINEGLLITISMPQFYSDENKIL